MALHNTPFWQRLILAGIAVLMTACLGCRAGTLPGGSRPANQPTDPTRVYAGYRFDRAPEALNFGVQPLWIPTCVIWEVMARDQRLHADLKKARCRLTAHAFFKGRDMNGFLRDGRLQGGMIGDLPALKAASEFDVRIVSLIQQGPCSLIARKAMRLEQLRDRLIGYAPGSNAHYTLVRILGKNNMDLRDVRLVPMDVIEMADALAERRIDAFSAWEPTPTLARLDHPSFEVLAQEEARGYLCFTGQYARQRPDVVRALVASEIRALRWLRRNDRNLYIACRWARDRAAAFAGGDRSRVPASAGVTPVALTAYDFLRLARRDLLRVPTAPRLLPELLAPSPTAWIPGEIPQQFRLSRDAELIDPNADWERVRRSFAVGLVPEILSTASSYHLDNLRLGPALPLGGQPREAASAGVGARLVSPPQSQAKAVGMPN
jgi:sulfonate transport system substrate-binding protein